MRYIQSLGLALLSAVCAAQASYVNSITATTQDTAQRVRNPNNYKWGIVSTATGDLSTAIWGVGSGYYATGVHGSGWGVGVKAEAIHTYGNAIEAYPGGRGTGLITSGSNTGIISYG